MRRDDRDPIDRAHIQHTNGLSLGIVEDQGTDLWRHVAPYMSQEGPANLGAVPAQKRTDLDTEPRSDDTIMRDTPSIREGERESGLWPLPAVI